MSGVTKIGGTTYTFPMPVDDVTVYAEFGEASSVPDPFDLALGDNTVTVVGEITTVCWFTPEQEGRYRFSSMGDCNPRITVRDGSAMIGENDDADDEDNEFDITVSLVGGKTYTLEIFSADYDDVITVTVEKADYLPDGAALALGENKVRIEANRALCYQFSSRRRTAITASAPRAITIPILPSGMGMP